MMKTINATKMVRGLFRPVNKQSFCMYWAPLDPRKHNTMNHNPHNMYLDRWEYGQYEDWVLNCSAPPRTYEPQVIDIIAKSLSEQLVHLLLLRELKSLLIYSTLSATDHGADFSVRTSTPTKPSMKFILQFWQDWLETS